MYGNVDIGYGTATTKSADGTSVDKTTGVVDGTQAPNRIGFRGVEDLGGGLKGGFVLEQGISPVSSNGFNQRAASSAHQVPNGGAFSAGTMRAGNVYVGGNFGEVRVGTMNRAGYTVASRAIVLAENFAGEAHAAVMPTRTTAVAYTLPTFSGVTAQIQLGAPHGQRNDRESAADATDGFRRDKNTVLGLNAQYTAGPLYLGAAYETTDVLRVANAASTTANAYGAPVAAGTAVAARSEKAYALGAQYDLGVAKLYATFANRDNGAATAVESTNTNFAVTVPVGAITLAAHSTTYKVKTGTATTNDISGFQLGAKYDLSKRTNVYLFTGTDKDKALAADKQSKRTRTVAGVAHSF